MFEKDEEYFARSKDNRRAVISVKCHDGRFYFVKDLRTQKIRFKSATMEEAKERIECVG